MALIAVLALDCVYLRAVLRTRNPEGLSTLTQALTLGMFVALRGRGRLRRFSIGFVAAGVAAIAGLIVTAFLLPNGDLLLLGYVDWATSRLSAFVSHLRNSGAFMYV